MGQSQRRQRAPPSLSAFSNFCNLSSLFLLFIFFLLLFSPFSYSSSPFFSHYFQIQFLADVPKQMYTKTYSRGRWPSNLHWLCMTGRPLSGCPSTSLLCARHLMNPSALTAHTHTWAFTLSMNPCTPHWASIAHPATGPGLGHSTHSIPQ